MIPKSLQRCLQRTLNMGWAPYWGKPFTLALTRHSTCPASGRRACDWPARSRAPGSVRDPALRLGSKLQNTTLCRKFVMLYRGLIALCVCARFGLSDGAGTNDAARPLGESGQGARAWPHTTTRIHTWHDRHRTLRPHSCTNWLKNFGLSKPWGRRRATRHIAASYELESHPAFPLSTDPNDAA